LKVLSLVLYTVLLRKLREQLCLFKKVPRIDWKYTVPRVLLGSVLGAGLFG